MPHMMTLSAQRAMMAVPSPFVPPVAPILVAELPSDPACPNKTVYPDGVVCCGGGGGAFPTCYRKITTKPSKLPSAAPLFLAPGTSFQRMRNLGISRR